MSRNLELLVSVQDCCPQIAQIKYQGQTRNTRILECKALIDTSYRIRHGLELKYFLFAHFLLNAHQAAHRPRKSENRELERSSRSSYGWLVSYTIDDCSQRQIAQKIFKLKIEACHYCGTTWPSNVTFHLRLNWLQTLVTINS